MTTEKLSLPEYLKDPCGSASIPYWKQNSMSVPDDIRIVHDRDYIKSEFSDYADEPYFRLYHDLKCVDNSIVDGVEIVVADHDMLDIFMDIINASYADLSVTKKQMEGCRKTPVYCSDLWVLLKDKITGGFVGSGIADYDSEAKELILEWVQVLPSYRGRGFGRIIVNSLLAKMQGVADFATVSGKINNPTNPESLYRKCGFTGDDIWHILVKRQVKLL